MKWAISLALMLGGASTQVSIAKLSRSTAGRERGTPWLVRAQPKRALDFRRSAFQKGLLRASRHCRGLAAAPRSMQLGAQSC